MAGLGRGTAIELKAPQAGGSRYLRSGWHRTSGEGFDVRRDARVSAAIYSFPGPPSGNLGLQLRGTATAIGAAGDRRPWLRFTIKPAEAWCFDSRMGRQCQRIDLSRLDLGPAYLPRLSRTKVPHRSH